MFSVNNLRLGSITASDYYLGSSPVQKMYLGQILVFDRTEASRVVYVFEITSSNPVQLSATDTSTTVSITSYKETYIGDVAQGDRVYVPITYKVSNGSTYTTVDEPNITGTTAEYSVTIQENITTSSRIARITFTQDESSNELVQTINQAAGTISKQYTFNILSEESVSIPSAGQLFTVKWESYSQQVINGVVQDAKTNLSVVFSELPDWITVNDQSEGTTWIYFAHENYTGVDRSFTLLITQSESNIVKSIVISQKGSIKETRYTWNVTPTSISLDGVNTTSGTFTVTSYKETYIDDVAQGDKTRVTFKGVPSLAEEAIPSTTTYNDVTMNHTITYRKSSAVTSESTYDVTLQADEGDNSTEVQVKLVPANRNYGDITITKFEYPDIAPASGGTLTPTVTYTQSYGYGDSTTDGGTVTSGATLSFAGGAVNASSGQYTYASKGTTVSSQTNTEVTVTVSMNGKTATAKANASQAANTATYGDLTGGAGTATDIPAAGGSVSATVSQNATQTVLFTSGATRAGNVTSSATSVSAESLGTEETDRTQVGTSTITFTGEGSKTKQVSVPVYQEANEIVDTRETEVKVTVSANPDTIPASGGTSQLTRNASWSLIQVYTSGAEKAVGMNGIPALGSSNDAFTISGTVVTVGKNTGAARSTTILAKYGSAEGTCIITQESGQEITSYGDITISGGSVDDIPASGGTVSASGCTATIVVNYSSGESSTISVPSSNITYTSVQASSLGTTEKARTKVGTSTCNVSYQGKTASKSFDVYQAANVRTQGTPVYGEPVAYFDVEKNTADAAGDIIGYTAYVNRPTTRTDTYTSGATLNVNLGNTKVYPTTDFVTSGTHTKVNYVTRVAAETGPYEYSMTIQTNTSVDARMFDIEMYLDGYGYIDETYTITQASGLRVYGYPQITNVSINDIPASGMNAGTYTYPEDDEFAQLVNSFTVTQTWGYGQSTGGGTYTYNYPEDVNSLGYVLINFLLNIPSKGTTVSNRTDTGQDLRIQVGPHLVDGNVLVDLYQEANTRTEGSITYGNWSVNVSANPTTVSAAGGTSTITRSATRTRTLNYNYTSGATSTSALSNETATPSLSSNQTWCTISGTTATLSRNDGGQRSVTIAATHSGTTATCTITQSSGTTISSYGSITISGGSAPDISAAGGTSTASGCTATIAVTYSNGTTGSISVPSSNIRYTSVSADSLGTTVKSRTAVGTATCTVTYQGQTATKEFTVYQLANTRTAGSISYGSWTVNVSANPTTIASTGGSSTITASASRSRTQNYSYTSGSTSTEVLSAETKTPTLSVSGTGFSLSGTTVTATANTGETDYVLSENNDGAIQAGFTGHSAELEDGPGKVLTSAVTSQANILASLQRSCTVTAKVDTVSKTCTITQSGSSASTVNSAVEISSTSGCSAKIISLFGNSFYPIEMTPEPEYGSKNEPFHPTVTVKLTATGKTTTLTYNLYKGYLNVTPTTLEFSAEGGTKTIDIDTNLNWEIVP